VNKKTIKCFDLDGTLIPTTIPGQFKVQEILSLMGLNSVDPEIVRKLWGKPFVEIAQIICHSVGAPDRAQEFIELEHNLDDRHLNLCNDLPQVLRELKKQSHLAIITSRSKKSFLKLRQILNFELNIFDFIQTYDDSTYHKPDPRVFVPLLNWANHLGINPNQITYFGDTVEYYLAAVKGQPGIEFVGVCSGASKASEFIKAGAYDLIDIVNNVSGLTQYLSLIYLKNKYIPV